MVSYKTSNEGVKIIFKGELCIVATPIGNLADISERALATLKSVDLVLCEDTRVTRKLLQKYDIATDTLSYHSHSGESKKLDILRRLVEGQKLALVTDAGTPGVSDPGNELIDYLLDKEPRIKVTPIPGVSSLTAALSICGFRVDKFVFLGFLPKKGRVGALERAKDTGLAVVFLESPRRLMKVIGGIEEIWGEDARIFVGRELTKMHEETYRGRVADVRKQLEESNMKGEVVVILEQRAKDIEQGKTEEDVGLG